MGRDRRTEAFLRLADKNQQDARLMLTIEPPVPRWIAVAAFYSSVHYIGAFLWEIVRIRVGSHVHREKLIGRYPHLKPISAHYKRLYDYGWKARYTTVFRPTTSELTDLLDIDLLGVEHCVKRHLPTP
jgi:hypothetical protein